MGPLLGGVEEFVRDAIEDRPAKRERLAVVLDTEGGYIEVVQRIADTMRKHYRHVAFFVPDRAMSAGTVLVMSGDEIWMDYYSTLGPIDPQIQRPMIDRLVPAVGYLEQYDRLIEKSAKGKLTTAELVFLLDKFDPAELYAFEQARKLSIKLLKEWLVNYKFKNWTLTETRRKPVTQAMRTTRAGQIARKLDAASYWHSHGRGISMRVLRSDYIKLRIEDFGAEPALSAALRGYHKLLTDYANKLQHAGVLHWLNSYTPFLVEA